MSESHPEGLFDQTAVAAVRQWKFRPARYQGDPVRIWVGQRLRFELN